MLKPLSICPATDMFLCAIQLCGGDCVCIHYGSNDKELYVDSNGPSLK